MLDIKYFLNRLTNISELYISVFYLNDFNNVNSTSNFKFNIFNFCGKKQNTLWCFRGCVVSQSFQEFGNRFDKFKEKKVLWHIEFAFFNFFLIPKECVKNRSLCVCMWRSPRIKTRVDLFNEKWKLPPNREDYKCQKKIPASSRFAFLNGRQ